MVEVGSESYHLWPKCNCICATVAGGKFPACWLEDSLHAGTCNRLHVYYSALYLGSEIRCAHKRGRAKGFTHTRPALHPNQKPNQRLIINLQTQSRTLTAAGCEVM